MPGMNARTSRLSSILGAVGLIALAGAQSDGYVLHKVMDTNGTGGLAMTFQVPKDWTVLDKVSWNLNLRLNPMSYSFTAGNEAENSYISYLSGLTFDFASNGFGGMAGKAPPQRASDFLMEDVKAVHPNAEIKVLDREDNPIPFPHSTVPGVVAKAFHSILKVRFEVNGKPTEENLSMDLYGYVQPTGGRSFRGNWFVSGLTVVHAPEGGLEAMEVTCNKVLASEKMSTDFVAKYKQVAEMLLEKTRQETQQMLQQRAQTVISGGGGHAHIMDKDEFIFHEEIKGLRSQLFSRSIGN